MPVVAAEPDAAVVTPSSGAVLALAWAAFFVFAVCGMGLRRDSDAAFLLLSLACGAGALIWTLRRVGGRRGGISAAAHRWTVVVAVMVITVAIPFSPRLRADAWSFWTRGATAGDQPIGSAGELEALSVPEEAMVTLAGKARCEVMPEQQDTSRCAHLRWGGDEMPTFERPVDPLADALRVMVDQSLGEPGPVRQVKQYRGFRVELSRRLIAHHAVLDTIVRACGPEVPPATDIRDAGNGCDRLKLTVQAGLWGHTAQKELLDITTWSRWMEQRASLHEAYMRDAVGWRTALLTVIEERDKQRLTTLLAKVRESQRGGVVLFLARRPAEPGGLRWPQSGVDQVMVRNSIDNALALPRHLSHFQVRGRVTQRISVPGRSPVYVIDANRPPMSIDQSLLALSLAACALLLLAGHGRALLWSDIRSGDGW